jgi:hypothetical protein
MKRYICFIILCLFSLLVAFGFSPGPSASTLRSFIPSQEHSDSEADLIAALDACIQQRFLDVDKGFGFRRLTRPGDTPHRFKAENAKELTIVEYLTSARLDVVLYLAGRGIVEAKLNSEDVDSIAGSLIKGPVSITPSDNQIAGLPTPRQLWNHSQEAMQVFQGSGKYDFSLGEWNFIARPVRASDTTCLECHQRNGTNLFSRGNTRQELKSLQIGDPLGLLVYGYKISRH